MKCITSSKNPQPQGWGFFVALFFLSKTYNENMRKIQHKQHHVRLALFVLIVGAFLFWAYGYFSNQIVYPATTLHDGKSYLDGA